MIRRSIVPLGATLASRALAICTLATSALLVVPAHAQSTERGIALFPWQAPITEPSPMGGLVRLPLPPEVLAGARPDLGDVRVHDGSGEEVPYAIDRGLSYPVSRAGATRSVVPYDAQEETTRRPGNVTFSHETYRLRPPAAPTYGGTWELAIDPGPMEIVRTVVIRAEPPFGAPREVATGAIFRFPRRGSERLAIALPGVSDEPLVVEISGEGQALHPRFALREIDRTITEPARIAVPLTIRETRRDGTRTVLVVDRPSGIPTDAIAITSSTGSFVRPVEITSTAPGAGPAVLGRGELLRVAGLDAPELLSVPLTAGGGDTLEIAIDDGDSPPLADLAVKADVRVPSLLFDAGRAATLRWGGSRARAPHYDLMTMDVASLVRDRQLATARLGSPEPNPRHDDTPALAFAMRAGQSVPLERATHRASLTVAEARDGLSRFRVPPAMWAEAREDLADLRVVDAEGRQWPYRFTLAPGDDELTVTVAPGVASERDPHVSVHTVALPARVMSPTILRIELPPQLLSRRVAVHGQRPGGTDTELGVASFLSSIDAPARLEVSLFGERVTSLRLEIDNGDEAPLAIEHVVLLQPAHEVQLVAPAGEYAVVVGDLEAERPSYDLFEAEALLELLLAEDATLGALVENPSFHEPTFFERSGWETVVLSALLALVVVVLFGFTLRVARSDGGAPASPAPASEAASVPAPAPASQAASAPVPASEPKSVPAPAPASEPKSEPEPAPAPMPASEPTSEPEPSPEGSTKPED